MTESPSPVQQVFDSSQFVGAISGANDAMRSGPLARPEPPKHREPEFFNLDLAHYSLEFRDTLAQKKRDYQVMFDQGYDAITGTEVGQPDALRVLRLAAHRAGYTVFAYKSNFVSLRKELIVPGSYHKGATTVVDKDKTAGRGHDSNIVWAGMTVKGVGKCTFLCSHYNTRQPENQKWNRLIAREVGDLAEKFGAGMGLVWYGGDQNIVDRKADTFFGEDLTSVWDELQKYENTGHGNIDVIASYDPDGRVEARYIRALDDREQFMHADHFPVEAGFKVRKLAA